MHRRRTLSGKVFERSRWSQNAFHGAVYAGNLALVYTLVGEQNQAITLIERLRKNRRLARAERNGKPVGRLTSIACSL
jgi:hypothetical protein